MEQWPLDDNGNPLAPVRGRGRDLHMRRITTLLAAGAVVLAMALPARAATSTVRMTQDQRSTRRRSRLPWATR